MDTLIVQNENGRDFDITEIADLWHIAQWLQTVDKNQPLTPVKPRTEPMRLENSGKAIHDVWLQAHAMRHAVTELRREVKQLERTRRELWDRINTLEGASDES